MLLLSQEFDLKLALLLVTNLASIIVIFQNKKPLILEEIVFVVTEPFSYIFCF
ncbi:MAG: hypothetical protein RLZZ86_3679 [Cyanobacteriota bacterium]|jgi:hypothetical protein